MNTTGQITVRQWLALPKTARAERAAAFRQADEALQANGDLEDAAGIDWETETYLDLNSRVCDLWPTVPWWIRDKGPLPETPAGWVFLILATAAAVWTATWLASRGSPPHPAAPAIITFTPRPS